MKRAGYLIEKIADLDNLCLAYSKACRGKQMKCEVTAFSAHFDRHISEIREGILNGNPAVGHYHYFTIFDPKERVICAASFPERVLHHAIMNICHPYFDSWLIDHTYATRPGKGVYAALDYLKNHISDCQWLCKLDVRKYFDSIDHNILKTMLANKFKDKLLLQILYGIIDSYECTPGKGLPIGNLTSQYFANMYLSGFDRYAKEVLKVKVYARYMDDILMAFHSKNEMKEVEQRLRYFAEEKLNLRLKLPVFAGCQNGITFLGYRIFPHYYILSARSKRRFRKKYNHNKKLFENQIINQREYQLRLLPLLAFVRHAKSRGFRMDCFKQEYSSY
ncbi:MAG: RNA-directed DNA polymerase [Sodaliphilus sp.]